jgi:hypothetical protein
MSSYEILRSVNHVRTDVLEECIASIIRVEGGSEIGTMLATPMMETIGSSEPSVITSATRRQIPKIGIVHSSEKL